MSGVVVKWLLLWLVPTLLHTLRICVLTTYLPYLSSYVSFHVCSYVRTYVGVYVGLYVGVYVPPYVSTVSCVLCVRRVVLCWSVSLLPPRSHFCLFVHRGSTVCGVLCVTRPFQRVELSGLAYPPYWGVLITQFCTPDASKFSLFRGGPSCGQR